MPLGRTGLLVSPIGLGTVKFGRSQGVKYPTAVRIPSDAEALSLLDRAAELGITLLDTAPAYGTSEERLGTLLRGRRDRWVICTKVGEEFEEGVSRFDFSPAAITASVERSLRRLRTDVIEVVLVHSDGVIETSMESTGVLDALRALRDRGLIKAFGASTKTIEGGLLAVRTCDVVMLTLNPQQEDDLEAIRRAHASGVGVLIKKVFGSGHLAQDEAGRRRCLELALGTPGVHSVIIGTTSPTHLHANATLAATCR